MDGWAPARATVRLGAILLALVLSVSCVVLATALLAGEAQAEMDVPGNVEIPVFHTYQLDCPMDVSLGRRAVCQGEKVIGTPYRKMNCSEFTSYAYRRASRGQIIMPAWDDEQMNYGRPVRGKLRRGDLMFFREHGGEGPATHVGIYVKPGVILHSSNYFNKVTESYYRYIENYVGARRIR